MAITKLVFSDGDYRAVLEQVWVLQPEVTSETFWEIQSREAYSKLYIVFIAITIWLNSLSIDTMKKTLKD